MFSVKMNHQTMDAETVPAAKTPAPARVLIVKLSSLGDLIHALPAVHCLKTGLPAVIDWVVNTEYADLVNCFSDVRRVIPFPRHALKQLPDFRRALQREEYDLIVDLQGLLKSAVLARLARGARRIGPSFQREGARWFYHTLAGQPDRQRHAVEQNLDIIRHLGLPLSEPAFPMQFPTPAINEPAPRVALIPCSRWPSKNWSLSAFTDVARELRERANAKIFIIGGQTDSAQCAQLAREIHGAAVNLAGRLTLPELGGWLAAMQLAITNDSGPMHIAAALGIPVLALFGPTDPARTGPYGGGHTVFKGRMQCQPCYRRHCRFGENPCLNAIMPEQVVAAAVNILLKNTTITAH